jgi:hypothetical protein
MLFINPQIFYTLAYDKHSGLSLSAEEIRQYLFENYIKAAKAKGTKELTIVSGEVHDRMRLKSRMPLVCEVLRSQKFQDAYNVSLVREVRLPSVQKDSSTNQ